MEEANCAAPSGDPLLPATPPTLGLFSLLDDQEKSNERAHLMLLYEEEIILSQPTPSSFSQLTLGIITSWAQGLAIAFVTKAYLSGVGSDSCLQHSCRNVILGQD